MGLDNDLDLKKLQEKIRLERERVANLEKEVKETKYFFVSISILELVFVFVCKCALSINLRVLGEGEDEAAVPELWGETSGSVTFRWHVSVFVCYSDFICTFYLLTIK